MSLILEWYTSTFVTFQVKIWILRMILMMKYKKTHTRFTEKNMCQMNSAVFVINKHPMPEGYKSWLLQKAFKIHSLFFCCKNFSSFFHSSFSFRISKIKVIFYILIIFWLTLLLILFSSLKLTLNVNFPVKM